MQQQPKKYTLSAILLCALVITSLPSYATVILYDWAFNIDGTQYENTLGDSMPGTGVLDANGLGSLTFDVTGLGSHSFVSFFDYEIDPTINSFFNEYGSASGAVAAGQSWEIDEPGFVFGDIYDHMRTGQLDNSNNVPNGANDDVSFALGWDFVLSDADYASITLNLTDTLTDLSNNVFYLTHTDPDSNESVYFWSTLTITSNVPEPSSLSLLLMSGLFLLPVLNRRKKHLQ